MPYKSSIPSPLILPSAYLSKGKKKAEEYIDKGTGAAETYLGKAEETVETYADKVKGRAGAIWFGATRLWCARAQ